MSRLENSAKNIFWAFGNSFIASFLGLISRTVFIHTLGSEYLGLSGLLNNVLGFLSISELGIATAIGFSLYKPLAEHDYKTVSILMSIYRRAYTIIGCIVLASGIVLFHSLDFFIPVTQQPKGTNSAYFIFLFNIIAGYFLAYKTTLISSDNQAFRLSPINVAFNCLQTVLQIIVLVIFKNYIAYLMVQIGCSILLMAVQNIYISKLYNDVDFYSKDKLSLNQKNEIKRNIAGLIIAKIGDYLVNSTDNLIITKLVSLAATGIYSNYLLIRNMVNGYIGTVFSGITAGMGNVVAVEKDERKKYIFNTLFFGAFYIYVVEATCFMCLFNTFIGDIWLGKEYLFDVKVVAIIVLNNYLTGLRMPLITMKGAAGKYLEDSWIPFAFAIINLIASVLLVKPLGVAGVFVGTIVGSLLTADWYRPIIIYRTVFKASVKEYYRKYVLYLILGTVYVAASYFICISLTIKNIYIQFLMKLCVAIGIPALLNYILFSNTREFKTLIEIFSCLIKRVLIKVKM